MIQDAVVKGRVPLCSSLLQTVTVGWMYRFDRWHKTVLKQKPNCPCKVSKTCYTSMSDLFWQRKSTSARELLSSRRTARWSAVSLSPLMKAKINKVELVTFKEIFLLYYIFFLHSYCSQSPEVATHYMLKISLTNMITLKLKSEVDHATTVSCWCVKNC